MWAIYIYISQGVGLLNLVVVFWAFNVGYIYIYISQGVSLLNLFVVFWAFKMGYIRFIDWAKLSNITRLNKN